MKNKFYSFILFTLLIAILTSCGDDFLNRVPKGSYTDADFYTTPEALRAATAPLYTRAWFDYNNRASLAIGSCRANDAYGQWFLPEYTLFTITSLHSEVSNAWQSFYSVVTMSNETIVSINNKATGVTEAEKNHAIAECRLMRGIAYFYLLRTWGPVILFEDNNEVIKNPVQPRHREEDVFRFIINDLKYASDNLPETVDKGRASCWGAKAMLAKVYLARSGWGKNGTRNQDDLDQACFYAADVCNNSGLKLLNNFEDLFKYRFNNNEESLIAMQWVPNGEWYVSNTLLSDLAFSTEVTGGVMCWSSINGSIDMLKQFESGDTKRRNASFFTNNTYYSYINIKEGGYTYTGTRSPIKKGVPGGPDDDNDGYVKVMNSPLNTYILRLADTYLTYAEASLGDKDILSSGEGLEYFNKVRQRAGLGAKSSINFDDIIRERRVEFCMEYTNWYDMVSWYRYKPEKMLSYFNNQQRGYVSNNITKDEYGNISFGPEEDIVEPTTPVVITPDNVFLPYPEKDLLQNPKLKEEPQPYNFNE
jgi:hypothetical protein